MIYIQHLPLAAKASYLTKLELLSAQENPYAACNADKVEDDMTLWPPLECGPHWNVAPIGMWTLLEYGHIFCYFVQRPGVRPGVYTQQELMQ